MLTMVSDDQKVAEYQSTLMKSLKSLYPNTEISLLKMGGESAVMQIRKHNGTKVGIKAPLVADPRYTIAYQREIDTISELSHKYTINTINEHFVNIRALKTINNIPILEMEIANGGSLDDLMSLDVLKGVSHWQVLRWIRLIIRPIEMLHQIGWVHGDVKPKNFLLQSDSRGAQLKICDFSLSGPEGSSVVGLVPGEVVGTPAINMDSSRPLCKKSDLEGLKFTLKKLLEACGWTNLAFLLAQKDFDNVPVLIQWFRDYYARLR